MVLNGHDAGAVAQAARVLAEGRLVAMPTETVYGLAARADDEAAVARIFAAKGRPSDHPLIVHVADRDGARAFTPRWTPLAERLTAAFWPGPLTVIVDRRPGIATAAAAGQDSVGLRCPAHPVAHALLREAATLGVAGVAAPSANLFGRVSPTTAAHVAAEFGDELLVLDGGPCAVGIESTIVDCRGSRPVLLRPGQLSRAQIEAAAGQALAAPDEATPRVSGSLASHYAPRATLRLMDAAMLKAAMQVLGTDVPGVAVYSLSLAPDPVRRLGLRWRRMPARADQAAQELFSVLRDFDAEGVRLIWVEEPPSTPEWEGVRDRLHRAAAS
ncbi:MAG: threonylcarbamoyl-AMP synthase [Ideonella sp.]|nr:threonylcarbamoyl-AMP synthase [Ideonella sp.]